MTKNDFWNGVFWALFSALMAVMFMDGIVRQGDLNQLEKEYIYVDREDGNYQDY